MMLHPRHRGDCADFFVAPHQSARGEFHVPSDVLDELEHAAARAGRTWNDQLTYIAELFLGARPPDFDDGRSVEDWRTLMRPCRVRFDEATGWIAFTCLERKTRGTSQAKPKGQ